MGDEFGMYRRLVTGLLAASVALSLTACREDDRPVNDREVHELGKGLGHSKTRPTKPPKTTTATPTQTTTVAPSTTTLPTTTTTVVPTTSTTTPQSGTCTAPRYTLRGTEMVQVNGYWIGNGLWSSNPPAGSSLTTYVCDESSWYSIASGFPNNQYEVFAYPNSHLDYSWPNGQPLSGFTTLTSTFAGKVTGSGYYNAGYDIWINGAGWACGNTEVMIWTETSGAFNPLGTDRGDYTAPNGSVYDVFYYNDGCMEVISYKSRLTQLSGTMNLRHLLNDSIARGYVSAVDNLVAVDYGIEIRHTATTMRFDVTDFSVSSS